MAVELLRTAGKVFSATVGASIAGAYAWNSTETRRMAWNVQRGVHSPMKQEEFVAKYCVFDLQNIRFRRMVALIGLKSSGKTTTLKHLLHNRPNSVFIAIAGDEVHGAIYNELKKNIFYLPWWMDGLRSDFRKDEKDRVLEVFRLVKKDTGHPVQLGLDVNLSSESKGFGASMLGTVINKSSSAVNVSFNPKHFVKQVKFLVDDEKVADAIISCSEGLEFLSVNEDRLARFWGHELSLVAAKHYLQELDRACSFDDHMLLQFPRTFANLYNFALASDKAEFCQTVMGKKTKDIQQSLNHCHNAKVAEALFREAVQRGVVDIKVVESSCGNEENFAKHFVVQSNIFTPCPDGSYRLQFDCTARAAKEVFSF